VISRVFYWADGSITRQMVNGAPNTVWVPVTAPRIAKAASFSSMMASPPPQYKTTEFTRVKTMAGEVYYSEVKRVAPQEPVPAHWGEVAP
jgi:hypothetical protein